MCVLIFGSMFISKVTRYLNFCCRNRISSLTLSRSLFANLKQGNRLAQHTVNLSISCTYVNYFQNRSNGFVRKSTPFYPLKLPFAPFSFHRVRRVFSVKNCNVDFFLCVNYLILSFCELIIFLCL